jgi:hypothetical protein
MVKVAGAHAHRARALEAFRHFGLLVLAELRIEQGEPYQYLHTLPDTDQRNLDAFRRIAGPAPEGQSPRLLPERIHHAR